MKRMGHIAFLAGAVVFWCAAGFLLAETCYVLHWRYAEERNPLIQARIAEITLREGFTPVLTPLTGTDLLPLPSPERRAAEQIAFFEDLGGEAKVSFALAHGVKVLTLSKSGNFAGYCGPFVPPLLMHTVETLCESRVAQSIAREIPNIKAASGLRFWTLPPEGGGGSPVEIALIRLRPSEVESRALAAFVWDPSGLDTVGLEESVWERPFFLYKPHLHRKEWDYTAHTNNLGFRDDEVILPKPMGVFRILCVGGSTVEEGSSNSSTYPNLLENKLREAFRNDRIEVINCGISGIDSNREMMRLPDFLMMEPDAIIYYNGVNDISYGMFPNWVRSARWWQRILRQSRLLREQCNGLFVPGTGEIEQELAAGTLANLRFFAEYAAARGTDLLFCSFAYPVPERLSRLDHEYFSFFNRLEWGGRYVAFDTYCRVVEELNRALKRLCDEVGAGYVPVAERIHGGTDSFQDICHMTTPGIELKADIVFRYLEKHYAEQLIGSTS